MLAAAAVDLPLLGPVELALRDPAPLDVAISGCFVLVLGVLLVSASRAGMVLSDRLRWGAVAALLGVLLVNQQLDLHVPLLRAVAQYLGGVQRVRSALEDPLVAESARPLVLVAAALAAIVLLLLSSLNRPPGPLVGVGLVLLLVHATGRAATFAQLVADPGTAGSLRLQLEAVEVIGLLLIAVGALRSRPQPALPVRAAPALRPVR